MQRTDRAVCESAPVTSFGATGDVSDQCSFAGRPWLLRPQMEFQAADWDFHPATRFLVRTINANASSLRAFAGYLLVV